MTLTYDVIRDGMTASGYGHFDETSTRDDGKTFWVHVASNAEYTYLDISPKRGKVGMDQCGIVEIGRSGPLARSNKATSPDNKASRCTSCYNVVGTLRCDYYFRRSIIKMVNIGEF